MENTELTQSETKRTLIMAKATTAKTTLGEEATKDWLTKKEFAAELSIGNLDQFFNKGAGAKYRKPNKLECQKIGGKVLYSPKYVEEIKELRGVVDVPKSSKAASPVRHIKSPDVYELSVSVYKKQLAIFESLGISEEKVVAKLKTVFDELFKKAQDKLSEVKNSIDF